MRDVQHFRGETVVHSSRRRKKNGSAQFSSLHLTKILPVKDFPVLISRIWDHRLVYLLFYYFTQKMIQMWNSLLEEMLMATRIKSFKRGLDRLREKRSVMATGHGD